ALGRDWPSGQKGWWSCPDAIPGGAHTPGRNAPGKRVCRPVVWRGSSGNTGQPVQTTVVRMEVPPGGVSEKPMNLAPPRSGVGARKSRSLSRRIAEIKQFPPFFGFLGVLRCHLTLRDGGGCPQSPAHRCQGLPGGCQRCDRRGLPNTADTVEW